MRVVVTGAAGHIGDNLVRALLARGTLVRVLIHQDRRALEGLEVEGSEGDVRDLVSLQRAFQGAEVVYHLAAHISLLMAESPFLESVNVLGTRNVVEACFCCGVQRLVHFSSIHALQQDLLDVPIDETCPLAESERYPPYDRSKAAGEREVQKGIEHGLDAIILRPTAVVGPYDFRPSHFGQVLLALAHRELSALIQGGYDWVDARDVVEGTLKAADTAPKGAKYLLSGHWRSIREVADAVERITGVRAPRWAFPTWLAQLGAPLATAYARQKGRRPLYTRASVIALCANRTMSHERATRDLGYHPRPFQATMKDTLRWFAESGRLPPSISFSPPILTEMTP
jgi:dihydroflavonol-4-reductase